MPLPVLSFDTVAVTVPRSPACAATEAVCVSLTSESEKANWPAVDKPVEKVLSATAPEAVKIERTKIRDVELVTPKLLEPDWKAKARWFGEKVGMLLLLLPITPAALADTRVTVPVSKSLTKTWFAPFAPDTRLVDADWNAILVLSGEKAASWLELPLAGAPLASAETSVMAPSARSFT